MSEAKDHAFQIMEATCSENQWTVAGLAFKTISREDVLLLPIEESGYIHLQVVEITLYGRNVSEITRGLTARLTLDCETDILLPEEGYLYK